MRRRVTISLLAVAGSAALVVGALVEDGTYSQDLRSLFPEPGMGIYSDSGTLHDWSFESIESYHVKRGWRLPKNMRVLVVVVDGHRFRFRIGHMLAANADHILRAVQAEAESKDP